MSESISTTRELTDEMKEKSTDLARKIKTLIEDNFLKAPNPEIEDRLKVLQDEIEAMGFVINIEYELTPTESSCSTDPPRFEATVILWYPTESHQSIH